MFLWSSYKFTGSVMMNQKMVLRRIGSIKLSLFWDKFLRLFTKLLWAVPQHISSGKKLGINRQNVSLGHFLSLKNLLGSLMTEKVFGGGLSSPVKCVKFTK